MRLSVLILLTAALSPLERTGGQAARVSAPAGAIIVDGGVRIGGDVPVSFTLSPAMLASMPRVALSVDDHGTRARFEGVLLSDVLARAGLAFGDSLRGARLATSIVVEARDGYSVVLAIAEVDSALSGRRVLLADRRDGAPMDTAMGPVRLIVEGDRRMSRAVRQVDRVRVVRARPF